MINQDGKYRFKGRLKGVSVAFEVNSDGSVVLCKEIVEEILGDEDTPGWLKVMLRAHEQRMVLTSEPVPQTPEGFTGWVDKDGKVLS